MQIASATSNGIVITSYSIHYTKLYEISADSFDGNTDYYDLKGNITKTIKTPVEDGELDEE